MATIHRFAGPFWNRRSGRVIPSWFGPGRRWAVTIVALILISFGLSAGKGAVAGERPPNIIVIFADDLGYADVGVQGQRDDVRTPHLDRCAAEGVRCTAGYITAPQCSPSRAGLITGCYQQRFGLDEIPDCPLPLEAVTIAERLQAAGYVSGMVGKWHLNPNPLCVKWARDNLPAARPAKGRVAIPVRRSLAFYPHHQGFDEFFVGEMNRYYASPGLAGDGIAGSRDAMDGSSKNQPPTDGAGVWITDRRYRLDIQTEAAVRFIQRNHARPFFLYLCYFAPHVPLDATDEYLSRFSGEMPERRRYALAMIAAIDDGVGRIMRTLRENAVDQSTLIVVTSDNGAPLKMTKEDTRPVNVSTADWDGSLNDPWVGEKGMLSEGGIRVPFILRWPEVLPAGLVYASPVSSLDIAATASAVARLPEDARLDGVNLIPYLTGASAAAPHEALFWRFWNQAAVRAGRWKYLCVGEDHEYLFDLESDQHEHQNLVAEHPDLRDDLRRRLQQWTSGLVPPGLPADPPRPAESRWYQFYFGRH